MQLRIATWNIRLGIQKGLLEITRAISKFDPHILILQEVGFFWLMGPCINVPLTIAMECGFSYYDFVPTLDIETFLRQNPSHSHLVNNHPNYKIGMYGHAIFINNLCTKKPKRESVITLPTEEGREPRSVLVTKIEPFSSSSRHPLSYQDPTFYHWAPIYIVSTHLSHLDDREKQGEALNNIIRDIKKKNNIVILGGDLNEPGDPDWFKAIKKKLVMAPNNAATYPTPNATQRLDYIFASRTDTDPWEEVKLYPCSDPPESDHYMLCASLYVPRDVSGPDPHGGVTYDLPWDKEDKDD